MRRRYDNPVRAARNARRRARRAAEGRVAGIRAGPEIVRERDPCCVCGRTIPPTAPPLAVCCRDECRRIRVNRLSLIRYYRGKESHPHMPQAVPPARKMPRGALPKGQRQRGTWHD